MSWKAAKNTNYEISKEDIEEWICQYGMIPRRAFVIFNTGWSFKRGNRYYGPDTVADLGKVDEVLSDLLGTNLLENLEYLIPGVLEFTWPGLSAGEFPFVTHVSRWCCGQGDGLRNHENHGSGLVKGANPISHFWQVNLISSVPLLL